MTALLSAKHEMRLARAAKREQHIRVCDGVDIVAKRLRATLPPSYVAILAESARVGWPELYKCDLEYDRVGIKFRNYAGYGIVKFVWVLRRCGTHLLWGHQAVEGLDAIARDGSSVPHRYYVWDGKALAEVGYEKSRLYLLTLGNYPGLWAWKEVGS